MILRRLSISLRKQDWFTVVIETLIVVFGVFMGLQVNNWNGSRADRLLGEDYVERLISDLERDLGSANALTNYYDEVQQSILDADRLLASPDPNPQALVVAAYRASEFTYNPKRRATWDQIVSSGHLGLLPGDAIIGELSDYYRFQAADQDTISRLQDTPYREIIRSLIPLTVQLAIREGCSDLVAEDGSFVGFVVQCQLDINHDLLKETTRTLMASEALREPLRYQYSKVASVQNNNGGDLLILENLLTTLQDAAGP